MRESQTETVGNAVPAGAFASLPASPLNWTSLAGGFLVQALLLAFLAETTISFMSPPLKPVDTHESVHLVAPQLTPPTPTPEPVVERKLPVPKVVIAPKLTAPQPPIQVPKVETAKVVPPPLPAVKTETFHSPDLVPAPKMPRTVVATNFGGSSAPVTVNKPAAQVQTGGFGDPNGVPVNPNSTGKGPAIAKVGSFDLPQGPGTGNGTGGSKGTPGAVASAGFGNGMAVQGDGKGTSGQGRVQSTNFGSVAAAPTDGPRRQAATTVSKETPVSLLSKPTPTYTLEAKERKIEGDVELEVEFSATGQVRVIRVVQGLGYGLDESAVKAAEKIRFSPARRDGQAVDAQGRLRIVFRLS